MEEQVLAAIDLALEEIRRAKQYVAQMISEAAMRGDIAAVKKLTERAEFVQSFEKQVANLKSQWLAGFREKTKREKVVSGGPRKRMGRLPEKEYTIPILEALIELGGSAKVSDVLSLVHDKVKDRLTAVDYQKLKSGEIRWRNTAQWCRNDMVIEGLLRKGSPRGIWEITEKGREHYYQHKNSSSKSTDADLLFQKDMQRFTG